MANHYVDFTNGLDTKDGHRYPDDATVYTTITGTDATHIHIAHGGIADGNLDDFLNGDFLYNVTRSLGALVSDYVHDNGAGDSVITVSIAGQTVGDTFYVLRSWQTVSKLATTLVAGETGYVRGGMTETEGAADIAMTNDGTVSSYITIEGCYTASPDPWHDGSTTRPIIDFNDGAYNIVIATDNYWKLKSLDITKSADTNGAIYIASAGTGGAIIEDCRIYNNDAGASGYGINISNAIATLIKDCQFWDNKTTHIKLASGSVNISGCTMNGGVAGTQYGIQHQAGRIYIKDSVFGVTTDHSLADISNNVQSYGGIIYGRNVLLDSTTPVNATYYAVGGDQSIISIEDYGQVHLAFKQWQFSGIIQRSTTYERSGSGGTAWSMLGEANSNCCDNFPLYLMGDWLYGRPIYLDGTEQTITVYALCHDNASTTYTNADKFRIEVDHYESSGVWATDVSSEDFAAEDTWTAFTVTLTPGAAGPACLRVKLLEYNANHDLYIDPKPVFS